MPKINLASLLAHLIAAQFATAANAVIADSGQGSNAKRVIFALDCGSDTHVIRISMKNRSGKVLYMPHEYPWQSIMYFWVAASTDTGRELEQAVAINDSLGELEFAPGVEIAGELDLLTRFSELRSLLEGGSEIRVRWQQDYEKVLDAPVIPKSGSLTITKRGCTK